MDTRVKKWLLIAVLLPVLAACASTPPSSDTSQQPNVDPYEGFNRAMYGFNNGLDTYLIKPIAQGYRFITPNFMETGVSNFFSNLLEIRNLFNSGLQAKGKKTAVHTGRFLVNSTVGVLGLIDVAQHMGMDKLDGEDFGQTMGVWGIGSGPYIVLPFLGPSTVRDGLGLPVDAYLDPVTYVDKVRVRNSLNAGEIIDTRARLLDTEKLLSGDRYIFIRDAYLQRREYLIEDGKVEDDFSNSLDESGDF